MRYALLVLIAALCIGCTVAATPLVMGGSRADGTITLVVPATTVPAEEVDWAPALQEANQRCIDWGYAGGQPFGDGYRQRMVRGQTNIYVDDTQWEYEREYQCIDFQQ